MSTTGSSQTGERWAAVTGLGVVSPAGSDVASFWNGLLDAKSMATRDDQLIESGAAVDFSCRVRDFDPRARLGSKAARRSDPFCQFAMGAAEEAIRQAEVPTETLVNAAVVIGNGGGGQATWLEQVERSIAQGLGAINPLMVPMTMSNAAPAQIALEYGCRGPNMVVSTACASGAHAIGEGLRLIRDGAAPCVIVGGTEAGITRVSAQAFSRAQALSIRSDNPAGASRPFDRDRDGFVLGEGAVVCVLEPVDLARERGATILGYVKGYGRTCDAHHLVMPSPDGAGAERCMRAALEDAQIVPTDIRHVQAHGTSTRLNDAIEARALCRVFGATPPVTSTKGVLGHAMGAAGAMGFAAGLLSASHGLVPPVANLTTLDDEISADVVARTPRPIEKGDFVVNSFGFGGHNATLIGASA